MMVMKSRTIRNCRSQKGGALIIMALLLLLAGTAVMFSILDASGVKIERDKKTAAALVEAKVALIGWSAGHATMPGVLPCPDIDNSGSSTISGSNCNAYIGRLPWKTLGLNDLRDGNGECLWYALSPLYRDTILVGNRGGLNSINSSISGTITVKGAGGATLPPPINPVIAVIFASGVPLAGQDRSSVSSTVCGGNTTASNYLDVTQGVNNSTGNVSGSNYTFIAGAASDTFNDRLVYITAGEFYKAVKKRMVKEILGNTSIHAGPVKYYDTKLTSSPFIGSYPFPASTSTGSSDSSLVSGFVNNSGMLLQYGSLGSWLANNGWFALANYTYSNSTHVKITLADALGSYSCDAVSNVFTCTTP